MKVKITEEHIEYGMRGSCFFCPIAKSVQEQTHRKVYVTGTQIIVQSRGRPRIYLLPVKIVQWIRDFDWGRTVGPVKFEVKPVKGN